MTIVCNNDPAYNRYVVSANRTQANSPSDAQYEKNIFNRLMARMIHFC